MLQIKHFHFSSIRLPVSSKTDGKPKNQSVDPLILNHLGEWVSAYTFPDRWTNSTVSTVPTFLLENSLETTQAGFHFVTRSVTSYKPRAPWYIKLKTVFSQSLRQLLLFILRNLPIGANGNRKACAPKVRAHRTPEMSAGQHGEQFDLV